MTAEIIDLDAARAGLDEFISESELIAAIDRLPPELLLSIGTNALRLASERRYDSGEARANHNCLIGAKRCIERLLSLGREVVHL